MSYLDRLRTAKYIAPSGSEFEFKFNDLERASGKKAPVHELPQQDDPDVKDLGNLAVRFAIEAFFGGVDYDQDADSFWDALAEKGPAILQHPRWGDVSVLPLTYTQGESFVDGMGRVRFEIEFVRVGEVEYPITTVQVEASIADQINSASASSAESFGDQFDPETAAETAMAKKSLKDSINDFSDKISGVVSKNAEISQEVRRHVSQITGTMDQLILDPITLANSYLNLFRLPGEIVGSIKDKVKSYKSALDNLASDAEDIVQSAVQFFQNAAVLLGLSESCLVGDIETREDAVAVAETVQDAMDVAVSNIETVEENVPGYAAPESILAQLKQILADTSALMLEKSFSLKMIHRITLEGDQTPLDLVYELYGDIDHLDEFIDQNRLQGDEFFMIPRRREVAYYG